MKYDQNALPGTPGNPFTHKRYALVTNDTRQRVEAYLPGNYRVIHEVPCWQYDHNGNCQPALVIEGTDDAGWTLDSYVIPRLASGLIWAQEIDLSHPVMKEVPA